MMGTEVWLTGGDFDELAVITRDSSLDTYALPHAHSLINNSSGEQLRRALQGDLVVLHLSGEDPRKTVSQLMDVAGRNHWAQRKANVVLKTQDSHHQYKSELQALDDIDFLAIAHGPYLPFFPKDKVIHVPCAIETTRSTARSWLQNIPDAHDVDVAFPFVLYRGEPRNAVAFEVLRNLHRLGHRVRFGRYRYATGPGRPSRLWEEMARARIILNLPLRNDLNIRTFEAGLFPSWQVTIRVPDSERVDFDSSAIRFAKPDSRSLTETILGLLTDSVGASPAVSQSRRALLNNHMFNDRMIAIVDHVLGTNLGQSPRYYDGPVFHYTKPLVEEIYTPQDLIQKSLTLLDRRPSNSPYKVSFGRRAHSTVANLARMVTGRHL